MKRSAPRLVLLLLAIVAMVLQAGSLPHLHAGHGLGFYNADHDLTLLAALAAHGLPGTPPQVVVAAASVLVPAVGPPQCAARIAQAAESRAPPRS
jgi:hypothetical protein